MTYYLVNENTDAIIEASPDRPSRAELLQSAEYFKCPVYLIEGQRVGYTAYPPENAPAPLPVDDSAPAVTFAEPDNRFEVTGWDEPTADEVTRFWSDENADERADVIREARYGKQL